MKTAEEIAALFHNTYERLAPSFGYSTRTDTKTFNCESPNGMLMIAVCAEISKAIQLDAIKYGMEFAAKIALHQRDQYTPCLMIHNDILAAAKQLKEIPKEQP